ncbi:protein S100-A1 [Myripristis murdjan]|uniref:protein S100-A1 n=1 Tax=Myripristis murdjan TaxID=586833 RepID=UPI001175D7EB|nr:protein S100-A1-like [Myripristis murdjan]
MSKLENAMDNLMDVFNYYATRDGDKFSLSRSELKGLLRGELCHYLEASRDPRMVDEIMCDLDKNMDGKVNFEEFVGLVTRLTVASCGYFDGYTPQISTCGNTPKISTCGYK